MYELTGSQLVYGDQSGVYIVASSVDLYVKTTNSDEREERRR